MKKFGCNLVLFTVGAVGYGLIEIFWRGRTHWSMLTAGGLCFSVFASVCEKTKKCGKLLKGIIGGGIITAVEFIFGIIFNIILRKNVWDYSRMPYNIAGQICLPYSVLWCLLSIFILPFAGLFNNRLKKSKKML